MSTLLEQVINFQESLNLFYSLNSTTGSFALGDYLVAVANSGGGGGGGANANLSNLSSPTAINQSLIPSGSLDFGSAAHPWAHVYAAQLLDGSGDEIILGGGILISSSNITLSGGGISVGANVTFESGEILDASGMQSIDPVARQLFANDGSTLQIDYSSPSTVTIANNLTLSQDLDLAPTTSATVGVINQNGGSLIHTFGDDSQFSNFFAGFNAGNFTMTVDTAVGNTGVGGTALASLTTGNQNTGVGTGALNQNTTGNNNIAFGWNALFNNVSGSDNVCFGVGALGNLNATNQNVAIGSGAGEGNNGITACTFIGYSANARPATLSNATAIGANAFVSNSNELVLGAVNGVNGATASTTVGIGVTDPLAWLQVSNPVVVTSDMGSLSVGEAPFDGASSGFFNGSAGGSQIAVNAASGFAGNLIDVQTFGVSQFSVGANGVTSTFGINAIGVNVEPTGTILTAGAVIPSQTVAGQIASFVAISAASPISTDPTTPIQTPNSLYDGQTLQLLNVGANAVTILAGGNVRLPGLTNYVLAPNCTIAFISYSGTWYTTSASVN